MEWITNPEIWISLVTLTVLEIVLGIDNIIFISILSGKVPAHQQRKARQIGLAAALVLGGADGDYMLASDPGDVEPLALALGRHVELIRV